MIEFYYDEDYPTRSISEFLGDALRAGQGAIMILTPQHTRGVRRALAGLVSSLDALERENRLVILDVDEALEKFMVKDHPDARLFLSSAGAAVDRLLSAVGGVHVAGELGPLLVARDNPLAALELEGLWNAYLRRKPVLLCCYYPLSLFTTAALGKTYTEIADTHGHVLPARERTEEPEQTGRWIARLQQQARALEAQIERRKRAEKVLAASRKQLQALGSHELTAREEERATIARRVHDELGQSLIALKIDLAELLRRLGAEHPDLGDRIGAVSASIEEIIDAVSRVAAELRPAMLDDLGLAATVEWQAKEFQARSGIQCTLELTDTISSLHPDQATALYRIFQAALANVQRHARASAVQVRMSENVTGLDLVVQDDGVGITQEQIRSSRSFGVIGMRERAQAIGATFAVVGQPGGGTTIRVHLPRHRKR